MELPYDQAHCIMSIMSALAIQKLENKKIEPEGQLRKIVPKTHQ